MRFGIKSRLSSRVRSRVLSGILGLVILGTLVVLGYVLTAPAVSEKFTEFYLLGLVDKADEYPSILEWGQAGRVVVGIINREQEIATYRIEVRIKGVTIKEVGRVTLEPDEKWEEIVTFVPTERADKQKVEFLLYKDGQIAVYQSLHFSLDVQ